MAHDVRSLGLKSAFPYECLISARVLRNPSVWVMLFFGLGPLVEFSLSPGEHELALFLVVYFAIAWCAFLYVFVAKRSVSLRWGLAAAAFSLFVGYPLDLLLSHVPPFLWLYPMTKADAGFERLVGYVLGVGVEEELIKAIPVMLLAFVFYRAKRPLEGIFFSALSGFGFAINESSKYIGGMHNPAGILGQTLLRTTALPFLHATWTSVSGYFIALAAVNLRGKAALAILGIALAAVVHGCFDAAPDGLPTISAGLVAFLLFVCYIARAELNGSVANEPVDQIDIVPVAPEQQEAAVAAGGDLP